MKRKAENLNDMLTLVRENPPTQGLFSSDDIRKMIGQDTDKALPAQAAEAGHPLPFTLYRNRIIMTSIISLILSGAMLLYFGQSTPTTQIDQINSASVPTIPFKQLAALPKGAIPTIETEGSTQLSERGKDKGKKPSETPQADGDKPELSDTLRIAGIVFNDLTKVEMEKIFGIRFTEDGVGIPNEESKDTRSFSPQQLKVLAAQGYDTTAAEFVLQQQHMVSFPPEIKGSSKFLGPRSTHLVASPVAAMLFDRIHHSGSVTMTMASDKQMDQIGGTDEQLADELDTMPQNNTLILPGSLLSRMIGVHIKLPYTQDGKELYKDLCIWYIPTPELIKALPARYRTSRLQTLAKASYPKPERKSESTDRSLIPGILKFMTRYPEPQDTARHYSQSLIRFDGNADISGINFLGLTTNELERLGLHFSDSGFAFTMQQRFRVTDPNTAGRLEGLGYNVREITTNVGFRVTVDTFNMNYKEIPSKEFNSSTLSPVLYSNRWTKPEGREGLSMIFNTESPFLDKLKAAAEDLDTEVSTAYDNSENDDFEERNPEYRVLNKLIPIRVRLESTDFIEKAGRYRGSEVILWYVPTLEFVNALPDRYRIRLEKELNIIASVEEGRLPAGEVCQQMAGDAVMLDFCRSGSGAVASTQVWPNPARATTTVHYKLTAPRQVAITLHDLTGRYLKELAQYGQVAQGDHEQTINLEGIETGTYLITVRTDKGEQGVQRLIVQ